MIARFFIERPVLANVIALLTMLLGFVAIFTLPVSQYPPITPPTVQVTTRYPGANAKTLINTVALPIEQQVNGVQDMLYMQSTSTNDGNYTLIVTFKVGTDLDFAQVLVQNRVAAALASLPDAVQSNGVVTKKKSTAILQIITLTSDDPRFDSLFLSNYASLRMRDELARLPGVGDVNVFGIGQYSMRVWLNPQQLLARSLTPSDVINAIRHQSQEVAAGQVGTPPAAPGQDFQLTVNVAGALNDVAQFEDIIVKSDAAAAGSRAITRVRDVARVELGAQTYSQSFTMDGKPAAGIAIFQLPEANALDVAQQVQAAVRRMSGDFPQGLKYSIPFDTTRFVSASIHEVYRTLFEAGILVLVVILVFLQNWRATLVPATTVPVTIIGAFAAMAAMGFSINVLTLLSLVLAIGIVVDDAIVVVEGVSQHIERGQTPHDASIAAMRELLGPIIGITLVLMSVFLPAAFMPGITGQMYRQFALVIAATALISAINAATLKPTQCALWLRALEPGQHKNWFYRGFDRLYEPVERAYLRLIGRMVERSGLMAMLAAVLIAASVWALTRIPTSFIPIEDQGYLLVAAQLPDAASLERTQAVLNRLTGVALKVPGVEHAITIGGVSALDGNASLANAGVIYLTLKDWDERYRHKGQDLRGLYETLSQRLGQIESARVLVVPPPPIQGIGNSGGFQMQVELADGSFDYRKLQRVTDLLVSNAGTQTGLERVMTTFRANVPQLSADINRAKAQALNVEIGSVFDTLQSYLGSTYTSQITKFGRVFPVFVQADSAFRLTPQDLRRYYVRSTSGAMVPIGTLADVDYAQGPALISLYNLYPSSSINGMTANGFSSGQSLQTMDELSARSLPPGVKAEWTAMSYQEKLAGSSVYIVFGLGILLVYFVLSGQYESWITPAAVIFGVPLALLGTGGALLALGVANNLYTQIGLVLLIALSAKNAILIVEVARELHAQGQSIAAAAVAAAQKRFRPIVMTSFAFILGVVPLVLATGAGASARKSIGIAVFSGMLASTCLAVLFVPSFFVILQRWQERRKAQSRAAAPRAAG
ncbi:MAG: efflux RND transporter permease subunit [Gammaproteobacteria bacterium]|nr:efflux RND transporter permease subunit [Gammaproteobacteria bacterium]